MGPFLDDQNSNMEKSKAFIFHNFFLVGNHPHRHERHGRHGKSRTQPDHQPNPQRQQLLQTQASSATTTSKAYHFYFFGGFQKARV